MTKKTDLNDYKIWKKNITEKLLIVNIQFFHRVKFDNNIFLNSLLFSTYITCYGSNSRTRFQRDWNVRRIHP